jgi:hypothetical protein
VGSKVGPCLNILSDPTVYLIVTTYSVHASMSIVEISTSLFYLKMQS